MPNAYLGVGSNLGDRLGCLTEAVRQLHATPEVRVVTVSSIYETKPVGVTDQPDFLNGVVAIRTSLAPMALLEVCLRIEAGLGRVRRERWGPRTLDLDLLWFAGVVMTAENLTLPHPRMAERAFVLVPLAEIAPQLVVGGKAATVLAAGLDQTGLRKIGKFDWAASVPEKQDN